MCAAKQPCLICTTRRVHFRVAQFVYVSLPSAGKAVLPVAVGAVHQGVITVASLVSDACQVGVPLLRVLAHHQGVRVGVGGQEVLWVVVAVNDDLTQSIVHVRVVTALTHQMLQEGIQKLQPATKAFVKAGAQTVVQGDTHSSAVTGNADPESRTQWAAFTANQLTCSAADCMINASGCAIRHNGVHCSSHQ